MTSAVTDVPWQQLEHAFGRAHDVPRLLTAISQSRGWTLRKRMEELWERVLHQGSIYSASPPAVRALIPMAANANGSDKRLYYELLAEFASSARQAIRNGRAIPCCSGGDPEHGRAILTHILEARDQFAPDLGSRDRAVRGLAGELLCCSGDAGSEAALLVRNRFEIERDQATRLALLEGLTRASGQFPDWPGFLAAALQRESDPALRFALRRAQIRQLKSAADDAAVAEWISLFLTDCESGLGDFGRFFEALRWLGPDRELASLLQMLAGCGHRDAIRMIAERVLRMVFDDARSGWESASRTTLSDGAADPSAARQCSNGLPSSATVLRGLIKIALLAVLWKIFPFLLRRTLRRRRDERNRRRYRIHYDEVKGCSPELPARFTENQQRALAALAAKAEVWIDETNLWALFGLPGNAAGLRALLASHA
ncbi:MAG TPA: hypothetical protein VKU19_16775 [Bryobacteraceae bacterium]|nr:hypothetical protein [Bryobacteraceae bacterium]